MKFDFDKTRTAELLDAAVKRRQAGDPNAGKTEAAIVSLVNLQAAIANTMGPLVLTKHGAEIRMAYSALAASILNMIPDAEKSSVIPILDNFMRDLDDLRKNHGG